jgi:hypothetical protein
MITDFHLFYSNPMLTWPGELSFTSAAGILGATKNFCSRTSWARMGLSPKNLSTLVYRMVFGQLARACPYLELGRKICLAEFGFCLDS